MPKEKRKVIKKMKCDLCDKDLDQLNPFDTGFYCDPCLVKVKEQMENEYEKALWEQVYRV